MRILGYKDIRILGVIGLTIAAAVMFFATPVFALEDVALTRTACTECLDPYVTFISGEGYAMGRMSGGAGFQLIIDPIMSVGDIIRQDLVVSTTVNFNSRTETRVGRRSELIFIAPVTPGTYRMEIQQEVKNAQGTVVATYSGYSDQLRVVPVGVFTKTQEQCVPGLCFNLSVNSISTLWQGSQFYVSGIAGARTCGNEIVAANITVNVDGGEAQNQFLSHAVGNHIWYWSDNIFSVGPFTALGAGLTKVTVRMERNYESAYPGSGVSVLEGEMYVRTVPAPVLSGPNSGYKSVEYSFAVNGPERSERSLYYEIDEDNDGVANSTSSHFITPVVSPSYQLKKTWSSIGTYTLKARGCFTTGDCSPWSLKSITITDFPPAKPQLTAAGGDKEVRLSWSMPETGGVVEWFELQRRTGSGPSPRSSWTAVASSLPASSRSFTDTTVTNGTVYEYQVIAFNAIGSGDSNVASAYPVAHSRAFDVNVMADASKSAGAGVYTDTIAVEATLPDGTKTTKQIPVQFFVTRAQPDNPNVFGWAWAGGKNATGQDLDTFGWISMNCRNTNSCKPDPQNLDKPATRLNGIDYGVKIDDYPSNNPLYHKKAKVSGFAWIGAEGRVSGTPRDRLEEHLGWMCFGESCPSTPPGVEAGTPVKAELSIDPDPSKLQELGDVTGWANILALGDKGWVQLNGNNFKVYLDVNSAVSVGRKIFHEFRGHAWSNGTTAVEGAAAQASAEAVGWVDFNCKNNSFGKSCEQIHTDALYPSCKVVDPASPFGHCFAVATDFPMPLSDLVPTDLVALSIDPNKPLNVVQATNTTAQVVEVEQGQEFQVVVKVGNSGSVPVLASQAWDVTFYNCGSSTASPPSVGAVDTTKCQKIAISRMNAPPGNRQLDVGQEMNSSAVRYTFPTSAAVGIHNLWVKIDDANEVGESDESNNVNGPYVLRVLERKPDLSVNTFLVAGPRASGATDATVIADARAGRNLITQQFSSESVTFVVGVTNTSAGDVAEPFEVGIYSRSVAARPNPTITFTPTRTIPLRQGDTVYGVASVTAQDLGSPGAVTLTAFADWDNRIRNENDENNNQKTSSFTIVQDPPDLQIVSMRSSKRIVKEGESFDVFATVKNSRPGASALPANSGVRTALYRDVDTNPDPIPQDLNDTLFASRKIREFPAINDALTAPTGTKELSVTTLFSAGTLPSGVYARTYTFCSYVDWWDGSSPSPIIVNGQPRGAVNEGGLGAEFNNGSRGTCVDVKLKKAPPPITDCWVEQMQNVNQALIRFTERGILPGVITGLKVLRYQAAATTAEAEATLTDVQRRAGSFIDNTSFAPPLPSPLACGTDYRYKILSTNEVETVGTVKACRLVARCESSARLEFNMRSTFPGDLEMQVGKATHDYDAVEDEYSDTISRRAAIPIMTLPYGQCRDAFAAGVAFDRSCANRYFPTFPNPSTRPIHTLPAAAYTTAQPPSARASIDLTPLIGELPPSYGSDQWYLKVRDVRPNDPQAVPPSTSAPVAPTPIPAAPPAVTSGVLAKVIGDPSMRVLGNAAFIAYNLSSGLHLMRCTTATCTDKVVKKLDPVAGQRTPVIFFDDGKPVVVTAIYPPNAAAPGDYSSYLVRITACDAPTSGDICPNPRSHILDTLPGGKAYNVVESNAVRGMGSGKAFLAVSQSFHFQYDKYSVVLVYCDQVTGSTPCPSPSIKTINDAIEPSLQADGSKAVLAYVNFSTTATQVKQQGKLMWCGAAPTSSDPCPSSQTKNIESENAGTKNPRTLDPNTTLTLALNDGRAWLTYFHYGGTTARRTKLIACGAPISGDLCPSSVSKNLTQGYPSVQFSGGRPIVTTATGFSESETVTSVCGVPTVYDVSVGNLCPDPKKFTGRLDAANIVGNRAFRVLNEFIPRNWLETNLKLSKVQLGDTTDVITNDSTTDSRAFTLSNGKPVVVIMKDSGSRKPTLQFALCDVDDCSSPTIQTIENSESPSSLSTLGGLPLAAYLNSYSDRKTPPEIKLAKCDDAACASPITSVVEAGSDTVRFGLERPALTVEGGKPVLMYRVNNGPANASNPWKLKIVACGTPTADNLCPGPRSTIIEQFADLLGFYQMNWAGPMQVVGGYVLTAYKYSRLSGDFNNVIHPGTSTIRLVSCDLSRIGSSGACVVQDISEEDFRLSGAPKIMVNGRKVVLAYGVKGSDPGPTKYGSSRMKFVFCDSHTESIPCPNKTTKVMRQQAGSIYDQNQLLDAALAGERPVFVYQNGAWLTWKLFLGICSDAKCSSVQTQLIDGERGGEASIQILGDHFQIMRRNNQFINITYTSPSWFAASSPRSGEQVVIQNPMFSWVYDSQGRTNAQSSWRIQVSTDPNFRTTVIDQSCTPNVNCNQTSFQPPPPTSKSQGDFGIAAAASSGTLPRGVRLYWRVLVADSLGTLGSGQWSSPQEFMVAPQPPGDEHKIEYAAIRRGTDEWQACFRKPNTWVSSSNPLVFGDEQHQYAYILCDEPPSAPVVTTRITNIDCNAAGGGRYTVKAGRSCKLNIDIERDRSQGRHRRDRDGATPVELRLASVAGVTTTIRLPADADAGQVSGNTAPFTLHRVCKKGSDGRACRTVPNPRRTNPTDPAEVNVGGQDLKGIEVEFRVAREAANTDRDVELDIPISVTSSQVSSINAHDTFQLTIPRSGPPGLCLAPFKPFPTSTSTCRVVNVADSGGVCIAPTPIPVCGSRGTCVICTLGKLQKGIAGGFEPPSIQNERDQQTVGVINPGNIDLNYRVRSAGSDKFELYQVEDPDSKSRVITRQLARTRRAFSYTDTARAIDPPFEVAVPVHIPLPNPAPSSKGVWQEVFTVEPMPTPELTTPINSAQAVFRYWVNTTPIVTLDYPVRGNRPRLIRRPGSNTATDCIEDASTMQDYHPITIVSNPSARPPIIGGLDNCNSDASAYVRTPPGSPSQSLRPKLKWTFTDTDALDQNNPGAPLANTEGQSGYQIQVFNMNGFAVGLLWDTGKMTSGAYEVQYGTTPSPARSPAPLEYNNVYQWRVRVWDNNEGVSAWSDHGTDTSIGPDIRYFRTPRHDDPVAAFTKNESVILVNTAVTFRNSSVCFDDSNQKSVADNSCTANSSNFPACTGGNVCNWKPDSQANAPGARSFWMFIDGTGAQTKIDTDEHVNPSHQFPSGGQQNIVLTVVDQNGYSSSSDTVVVPSPLPPPLANKTQCLPISNCLTPSCIQQCVSVQSIEFKRKAP